MTERRAFRAAELLRALANGGVDFIVIGGIAAQAHGSPVMTEDLDICFRRDRDNLERLAGVLDDLAAIRRGLPPDVPGPLDVRALRAGTTLTLTTRFGDLDLLAHPDPGLGYEALMATAVAFDFDGTRVLMAGIDDLIAMKRAANRPKDQAALQHLVALREEADRRAR